MPDYGKLITCMSASKTFNMAGLMFSDIIIRDAQLRKIFCKRDKIVGFVNPLSVAAHQAAYEKCDEWLAEFKTYLDENFMFVKEYLAEHLPAAVFSVPEATYLAWVNLKGCLRMCGSPGSLQITQAFCWKAAMICSSAMRKDMFV